MSVCQLKKCSLAFLVVGSDMHTSWGHMIDAPNADMLCCQLGCRDLDVVQVFSIWNPTSEDIPDRSRVRWGNWPKLLFPSTSQVVQWWIICLPVQKTQETWVRSLGLEDPLEKEMATHSSILVWEVPWTEEPGRLQSMGSQRVRN